MFSEPGCWYPGAVSLKSLLFWGVLLGGVAAGFWYADRLGGCIGDSQSVRVYLHEQRTVACNTAWIEYTDPPPYPMATVSCEGEEHDVIFHPSKTSGRVCGVTVTLVEATQDYSGEETGAFDVRW